MPTCLHHPLVFQGGTAGEDHTGDKLGPRLCALDAASFLNCLSMSFDLLLHALHRAHAVHRIVDATLVALAGGANGTNGAAVKGPGANGAGGGDRIGAASAAQSVGTARREGELQLMSQKSVRDACELAQKTINKLLNFRKEVHTTMSIDELRALWTTSFEFINTVEKLSGTQYVLRQTLFAQVKAFHERKFDQHMTELTTTLDSEKWVQADVSPERQMGIDNLATGQAFIPGKLSGIRRKAAANGAPGRAAGGKGGPERPRNDAVVEGSSFKIVWSVLLLIEHVTDNLAVAAHFPIATATEVLQVARPPTTSPHLLARATHLLVSIAHGLISASLLCFVGMLLWLVQRVVNLLDFFNTRATNLIIEGGAVHSAARLKQIHAKHLALCSQCLGLVMTLLPHIRAALSAQLPPKHHLLLKDLDRVRKSYREHHERILSMFVTIVGDLTSAAAASVAGTNWVGSPDLLAPRRLPSLAPHFTSFSSRR